MPKLQLNAGGMGQATWGEKQVMAGRLICDTYMAAKENLRETTYTLTELTKTQLGKVSSHSLPLAHIFCTTFILEMALTSVPI